MMNNQAFGATSLRESRPQSHELGSGVHLKMTKKMLHVLMHGSRTEHQFGSDLFLGESSKKTVQHLLLPHRNLKGRTEVTVGFQIQKEPMESLGNEVKHIPLFLGVRAISPTPPRHQSYLAGP